MCGSLLVRSIAPGNRAAMEGVDVALIDATNDHAQAADAFSQAVGQVGRLGSDGDVQRTDARRAGNVRAFAGTCSCWVP